MIVNEEDSEREVQDRFRALGLKDKQLPVWFRIMQGATLTSSFVKRLVEEAKAREVGTIIFDSLRAMHDAEENDSTEMQKVLNFF